MSSLIEVFDDVRCDMPYIFGSSAESVGDFRLWQLAKCMIYREIFLGVIGVNRVRVSDGQIHHTTIRSEFAAQYVPKSAGLGVILWRD